jgi:hypothetical protein
MENGDVRKKPFEMQGGSGEGFNMHILEVSDWDGFNMRLPKQEDAPVTLSPRLPQTVANSGDHQDSPTSMDLFQCPDLFWCPENSFCSLLIVWLFTPTYASSCPIEV